MSSINYIVVVDGRVRKTTRDKDLAKAYETMFLGFGHKKVFIKLKEVVQDG